MNEGHWSASDWWSLGVLIFELCHGLPPFYQEDKLAMYRKIVQVRCTAGSRAVLLWVAYMVGQVASYSAMGAHQPAYIQLLAS